MKKIEHKSETTLPPSDPSNVIRFGVILLILVFGVIGGWMAYAPLASSSVASGEVIIGGNKQVVRHLDGGRVKEIYVKDGDKIQKGDRLIKLDDVQFKEMLKNLESELQSTLAEQARLQAELDNKDTILFPEGIQREIQENQERIFRTRKRSLKDEELIAKKRVLQTKKEISSLEALIAANIKRLKEISKQLREQNILFKEKLIDKLKIQELQKEENRLRGELSSKRADIARLKEKISEIEAQELLNKKRFREEVLDKLIKSQSKLESLKARIATTKDKLKRTEIKAPVGGTIVGIKVHTAGDIIKAGEEILEIVPNDYKPLIVAYINLQDIDRVHVGEMSKITFPAFDMQNMQPIDGKVIYVSADSMESRKLRGVFYQAKIELTPKGEKMLQENNLTLVAGMPAVAMINTGERTVLEYLIKPFKDMFRKSFNEE